MNQQKITLDEITIKNHFCPGDIGWITYLHGVLYHKEYNHGIDFEAYVAAGLADFYHHYDTQKDRAWICEYAGIIVGTVFLQHKGEAAQLRYFLIHPDYRGVGLGKKLMELYMDFLLECEYKSSFLWTTNELKAASSLYTRHDFVLTEEKPSKRFGKPLSEQKYEWKAQ